jgi:hypothetical protein
LNPGADDVGRSVDIEGFVCADIQKVVATGGGNPSVNPCMTDDGLVLYEEQGGGKGNDKGNGKGNDKGNGNGNLKEIDSRCIILKIKPEPCNIGGATGGSGGVWTGAYVPPRLVQ